MEGLLVGAIGVSEVGVCEGDGVCFSFAAPCPLSSIPAAAVPVERGFRPDKSNLNLVPVTLCREKDAPVQKNAVTDFHPFDL